MTVPSGATPGGCSSSQKYRKGGITFLYSTVFQTSPARVSIMILQMEKVPASRLAAIQYTMYCALGMHTKPNNILFLFE